MRYAVDHYLKLLEQYDPLTEEQHAVIEARVRRDVLARYGSFTVPVRRAVHTAEAAPRGTLILLRPTFAFAAAFAIVFGALAAVGGLWSRSSKAPSAPLSVPHQQAIAVAHPAPVIPGSGSGVSVFKGSGIGNVTVPRATRPPGLGRRSAPTTLTPSEHVFGQPWGTSVFSERELRRLDAERVGVFSG